ncbi:hypothetical protein EYF80_037048 [Liparis tanakae]|uniref:Uncharacterized protein n=1 Tax=Liparis tanakae TaxID=230148 RepID=A0A4Z2GIX7_9TELE|nr:hypothetical protein EYF80_037048 [Liparis tanakae]
MLIGHQCGSVVTMCCVLCPGSTILWRQLLSLRRSLLSSIYINRPGHNATEAGLSGAGRDRMQGGCELPGDLTPRKKREPLGRSIRWDRGSSLSVSTRSPSLYHSTIGVGRPSALQLRVAGSPLDTIRSDGCSTTLGDASSNLGRDPGGQKEGGRVTFEFII